MPASPIWYPYTPGTSNNELRVTRAHKAHLHLEDGRKILDAISSWWVTLHGHAHHGIAEAIAKQALTLEQVIFSGFSHEPAETLATRLISLAPGNMSRVFFSDNGSTAVEVAIKMALQYFDIKRQNRSKVIALENAYHGDTFGAMAVGARGSFNRAFQKWLFDAEYITPPYTSDYTASTSLEWDKSLSAAEKLLSKNDVAALIVEPILQGAGGMKIYPKKWLEKLFELARAHNTLLIADEVFTGFYRTGQPFASNYLSISPDIYCFSKGLTGGFMPMGITLCNEKVADPFQSSPAAQTFYHGHSFTGNPLACAAANASLDATELPDFKNQLVSLISFQEKLTAWVKADFPSIEARGIGTIAAFTLGNTSDYQHPIRQKIYTHFLEKNILLRPLGNTLYTVPIFCTEPMDLEYLANSIINFFQEEVSANSFSV